MSRFAFATLFDLLAARADFPGDADEDLTAHADEAMALLRPRDVDRPLPPQEFPARADKALGDTR